MREATTITALLAAGALITMISASPAAASDREYRFAGADLSNASGVEHVYSEIYEIAEEICDEQYDGSRLVRYRAERERCIVEVVDDLVVEVDHPRLSRVHAREAGR
jgi:UrcA family protein